VISFVRADHIGRPVFATNSTGVKIWSATYQPFGGVHVSTGTLPTARFPGQWFQSESGLHQNWMRDYDPTTGRYLQADPLGLVDGASVYGYAGQSPMMNMDPTGECFGPAAVLLPVCVWAAWMVYDYLTDPDCYTLSDFLWSAVMNADPFKAARWVKGWTRPKFRNKTPRNAWNNAEDGPNGGKKCPDCGKEVFGDPNKGEPRGGPDGWDVNHEPKVKDRDYDGKTRPEQIDDYQTGTDLKCRSCNRKDNK
jgi:RHS repeat-associated protein